MSYSTDPSSSNPDVQEGPSSYASSTGAPILRHSLSHRDSRPNWHDSSPMHHNEGTSYFPISRPVSPSVQRRHYSQSGYVLPRSTSATSNRRSQVRSTSVSSSRQRHRTAAVDEEDEPDSATDAAADDESDSDELDSRRVQELEDALSDAGSLDPVTLKERQSLINVEHPFGLPIWKPALYKKSRTVTRNAEVALHAIPSGAAERHLLPGNIFWTLIFGWWLAIICFLVSALLYCVPFGGKEYGRLVFGLGWYLLWPFGKYLEGDIQTKDSSEDEDGEGDQTPDANAAPEDTSISEESDSGGTIRGAGSPLPTSTGVPLSQHATITPSNVSSMPSTDEAAPLLGNGHATRVKDYGTTAPSPSEHSFPSLDRRLVSRVVYWILFLTIIAPIMSLVALICYAIVFTIPMAKLNMALLKYLFYHPLEIRFLGAPPAVKVASPSMSAETESTPVFTVKSHRLTAGQAAPSGSPHSTVLLCVYRAVGWQYYKYTIGGVNIFFVNLMGVVFLVILDGLVLLPMVERKHHAGEPVNPFLKFFASQAAVFFLSLASVIPLSYFIGMAVASISAQSSIGMGAVINATFGSIIEIILYGIALTSGKGRLVEGSIVGSLLAGVLLMPGVSMISGAFKHKEQKFNAKSAGVTSTMLIMAIIGTLTPTLFYQTYGDFTLVCDGCPKIPRTDQPWSCRRCYYEHTDPANDPFYQETVKSLMYLCASILVLSYLIGLWFSLRTHASQIWQNPQQLMQPLDAFGTTINNPAGRVSLYNKLVSAPITHSLPTHRLHRKESTVTLTGSGHTRRDGSTVSRAPPQSSSGTATPQPQEGHPPSPVTSRKVAYAATPLNQAQRPATPGPSQLRVPPTPGVAPITGYTPILDSVNMVVRDAGLQPMQLPPNLTTDDFTRAVAVATVSALRHQHDPHKVRAGEDASAGGHGGHDAPSWSRTMSASVLLSCTLLYAIIAEILVEVVDVVLEGSGIDEKFLGITLFALVPNTTEFMNAISFAINGNIALSMEIGSAYALQVCLLQIPAMVAFSAWRDPKLESIADTFTLIFPRWDVIAIILSIFLLTYTYIEAKANYYRGSILVLSYIVLTSGFYFAPPRTEDATAWTSMAFAGTPSFVQTVQAFFNSLWMH